MFNDRKNQGVHLASKTFTRSLNLEIASNFPKKIMSQLDLLFKVYYYIILVI